MWMLDTGKEYKSNAFDKDLKNRGIRIFQSISYIPQQNSWAEQLMQTLSDKAESMCVYLKAGGTLHSTTLLPLQPNPSSSA